MSNYIGDHRPGDVIDAKFATFGGTGAPVALVGGVVSVYKDNSTTESTAGLTFTSPFDSRTGFHHVRITTVTDGTFYSAGSDFFIVITTGTVSGTSAIGTIVATFSLENRSALMPTTAGRTVDISATGEAGVDWANVGAPTTTLNLSGTTIAAVTGAVGSVTGAVGSVTGNVGGNVTGTVASVPGAVGSVTGNVGGNVNGNVVGSVGSVAAGGIAAASFAAGAVDAAALSADAGAELADAFLDRNMATGTDSGSTTIRTPRQAFRHIRNKWLLSTSNDLTVYKENDSTVSWTTVVTGSTEASPIIGSDPAGP